MSADSDLKIEMAIPPEWDRIDPLRKAVSFCVAAVFANDGLKDALSMACSELLENAIKYGPRETSLVRVVVHEVGRPASARLTVSVSHAISEADADDSAHVATLRARLAWLRSFASPSLAYEAALARVGTRSAPDEGTDSARERAEAESGLGLARIAYEGGCELECDTSSPGVLTMHASCAV